MNEKLEIKKFFFILLYFISKYSLIYPKSNLNSANKTQTKIIPLLANIKEEGKKRFFNKINTPVRTQVTCSRILDPTGEVNKLLQTLRTRGSHPARTLRTSPRTQLLVGAVHVPSRIYASALD